MNDLFDLSGKVAVITGAGGVLCGEMARAVAAAGAKVAVLDLNEQAAGKVAEQIKAAGGTALAVKCDVLDKASVEGAYAAVSKGLGEVDILINGAGGNRKEATTGPDMAFFDLPTDAIRFVFDLNFIGTLLPCQVFGKAMAERSSRHGQDAQNGHGQDARATGGAEARATGGVILNISSMNAFRPLTKIAAYSAAKAAISNFTQWLAVHICQNYSKAIRVNAVAPGFFLTEQNRFLLTDEKTGDLTPRGRTIIDHTPMGRFGDPGDLTGTVLWLLSDAAKFVTGVVVPVDGGFSAFSGV
ncbi:MAG TPA: SDR family oxidoreductase [Phycisphaerales bacterium]|nr:SDR family oxidoreductase [Phycisphaerales bacterium]